MIDKFLKAKHWQIFILTFGIPLIFQFIWMFSMISNFNLETNPDATMMLNQMRLFPVIMILYMAVFLGWFWSVSIGLQSKIPENVIMKVKKFKVFFFIPLVYISLIFLFIFLAMNGLFNSDFEQNVGSIFLIFAIVFPLHLFAMFCMFYMLYFTAKTFKTVELQREVVFGDFAGEFFLLWFFPVGIWIVQPKINKMVED